jgi:hypothetical protein
MSVMGELKDSWDEKVGWKKMHSIELAMFAKMLLYPSVDTFIH